MTNTNENQHSDLSRRRFVQAATITAASTPLLTPHVFGGITETRDILKVGVIGCGGRGTGAAINAMDAADEIQIHALGDVFADRLNSCRQHLASRGARGTVADSRCFTGFDAFRGVIGSDVDVVILATPPHFRPEHFRHAVQGGKHVFMEKPVAVDPAGVRMVIEGAKSAKKQNLSVVAGTQRRHEASYLDAMRRVEAGAIGDVVAARCYWNQGGLWVKDRQADWSDMEWQLRNWLYFTWLSGDHICEQHIHNIDVVNWAMGGPPVRAYGMGGRQVRTDTKYGHIFDHFAIEYEYEGGRFAQSMCRQIDGTDSSVQEVLHGSNGTLTTRPGFALIEGADAWRFTDDNPNPYVQEHRDLYESIWASQPLNEAKRVAESTLTAIMGRMSAYTGKAVTWEQAMNSSLDLTPHAYEFGAMPVPAVAVPGQTPLA